MLDNGLISKEECKKQMTEYLTFFYQSRRIRLAKYPGLDVKTVKELLLEVMLNKSEKKNSSVIR